MKKTKTMLKNRNAKLSKKTVIVAIAVLAAAVLIFVMVNFRERGPMQNDRNGKNVLPELIQADTLPKFIQADWIDLSRIGSISKFRSSSGHDFSGNGETCRSMKHYFNPIRTQEDQNIIDRNKGYPPPFSLDGAIEIYSPVDGKIISVESENSDIGKQVYLRPDNYPEFTIRLFHIFLLDEFKKGSSVKAGERIGSIGRIQNADIAVVKGSPYGRNFISYFEVMTDEIFAKYQALGIKSKNDLILTKEYRDAHPLECNGERFAVNYDQSNSDEFIYINQN